MGAQRRDLPTRHSSVSATGRNTPGTFTSRPDQSGLQNGGDFGSHCFETDQAGRLRWIGRVVSWAVGGIPESHTSCPGERRCAKSAACGKLATIPPLRRMRHLRFRHFGVNCLQDSFIPTPERRRREELGNWNCIWSAARGLRPGPAHVLSGAENPRNGCGSVIAAEVRPVGLGWGSFLRIGESLGRLDSSAVMLKSRNDAHGWDHDVTVAGKTSSRLSQ